MTQPTTHSDSVHVGEPDSRGNTVSPWSWVPTIYFAQGLQYSVTIQVFAIIFFTMGVSQGDTLFWTGVISFPWMIKPLWGPLVDRYGSKRGWTWLMQLTVGAAFAISALSLLLGNALFMGLPLFMVGCVLTLIALAFAAASHDIACDGFYMLALSERKQAFFVGMRSTFFQAAMMFANGALIWLAGSIQSHTGLPAVQSQIVASETTSAASDADRFSPAAWPATGEPTIQIMPATLDLSPGAPSYLTVRLSQAPPQDKPRIVVLRLASGDKGIAIPKDATRLEFTAANWQQGIDVPVTCDPRLRGTATDVLAAQSGNIPISWSAVALLCAAIFLAAALWHRYILPRPRGRRRITQRPPSTVSRRRCLPRADRWHPVPRLLGLHDRRGPPARPPRHGHRWASQIHRAAGPS
jgi:MFS family permease